jgi:hypothetical protein
VRWRAVLWQLEVEGNAPAAVAPRFGLSANGVSALAVRAREGLRQAYLREHIGANIPVPCRAYTDAVGAGARGRLSRRRRAAVHEHLRQCPACSDLFTELSELNSRRGAILVPVALAGSSAATPRPLWPRRLRLWDRRERPWPGTRSSGLAWRARPGCGGCIMRRAWPA